MLGSMKRVKRVKGIAKGKSMTLIRQHICNYFKTKQGLKTRNLKNMQNKLGIRTDN